MDAWGHVLEDRSCHLGDRYKTPFGQGKQEASFRSGSFQVASMTIRFLSAR